MILTEVRLTIADFVLALRFQDHAVAQNTQQVLAGFLTPAKPNGVLEVDWIDLDPSELPREGQLIIPPGEISDRRFSISWDYFHGNYQLDSGTGSCTVKGWIGLHKFLWALMSVVLPEHDGLVLHASSVSDGERAYVFPAASGTGKSTLVQNSPDMTVLSDEGSLVRLIDGRLYAYGSPFRSDEFRNFATRRLPVHGIYFLKQSPHDQLMPLGGPEAFQRLFKEIFLHSSDPHSQRCTFQAAVSMLQSTKAFVLELTNSPSFWRCIGSEIELQTGAGVQAAGR